MAMSVGGRRGAIADINVTPMADVMIVLLIIFMVATPLITTSQVKLPSARQPVEKKGERIEILVRGDGDVLVDGALVPLSALSDWIGAQPRLAHATVLVQADRTAAYAEVAPVLAACRKTGVGEIALAAELRLGR